jgi:ribosomal protein S18 acetylase RimI-like enzyme
LRSKAAAGRATLAVLTNEDLGAKTLHRTKNQHTLNLVNVKARTAAITRGITHLQLDSSKPVKVYYRRVAEKSERRFGSHTMPTPTDAPSVFHIRPIRLDDGPGMWDLFGRLSPASRTYFYPHPFAEEVAHQWAARADDPAYVVRVAADAAGRLVGYAWYNPVGDPLPTVGIGVADEAQNRGLGRRLIESLLEMARVTGRDGLRLTVHKDNVRAQSLYGRYGFRFCGDDPTGHQYVMVLNWRVTCLTPPLDE